MLFTAKIYIQNYRNSNPESSISLELLSYSVDTISCGLICYLNHHEVKTLLKNGSGEYFTDIWNYVDIALFATFASELVVNYLVVNPGFENFKKFLQTMIILLLFMKLNFYLRIFEGFSFLV